MSGLVRSLREGAVLSWRHLAEVIAVNLLWLALAWTVVGFGPATLAAYSWLARRGRDGREMALKEFFPLLLLHFWKGLLWAMVLAALVGLAWANLSFWPRVLPDFGVLVVQLFWLYLMVLALAVQPYALESLTLEGGSFRERTRLAALRFLREPLVAHLRVMVPVGLLLLGLRYRTLIPVVLMGVYLMFMAVSVKPMYVAPVPQDEEEGR